MDKSCIRKIGILRALQLGDLMCSIPAIRALKAEFPNAEIFLISLPSAKSFVYRFPHYFNGLIKFPGYPGLPEQPFDITEIVDFIHDMQKQKFDLLLQMHGNGNIVNPLVELFGSYYTAGFHREADYVPKGKLFIPYPGGHEVDRHISLMTHLGIEAKGKHLEFPLNSKDEDELKEAELMLEPGSYVCIHPGSRDVGRQWPDVNYARIADICAEKGKQVVITGTSDEISIAMETAALMNHQSVMAVGMTTLGAFGVLIKNAFAIISNCTGVSHIASALNTPGIIISMDGEPERWGPLNNDILHTIDWLNDPNFDEAGNALTELFEKHQGKEAGAY